MEKSSLPFSHMRVKRLLQKSLYKTCHYVYNTYMIFIIYKHHPQTFFPLLFVSFWDDTHGRKFKFMHKLQRIHGRYGSAKQSLKQAQRKVEPYLDCCCSLRYASHETLPDTHLTAFQPCLLAFFSDEQGNKGKLTERVRARRKLSDRVGESNSFRLKERSKSQSFCFFAFHFLPFPSLFCYLPL